jgi:acyl-coenzyme A thioesterase PaaI-like protein
MPLPASQVARSGLMAVRHGLRTKNFLPLRPTAGLNTALYSPSTRFRPALFGPRPRFQGTLASGEWIQTSFFFYGVPLFAYLGYIEPRADPSAASKEIPEANVLEEDPTPPSPRPTSIPPNPDPVAQQQQQSSSSHPAKRKPLWLRVSQAVFLSLALLAAGFTMAAAPALTTAEKLIRPPSDAETLQLFSPDNEDSAAIEETLHAHPLTTKLFADPKFIASRPHLKIPAAQRAQSLTAGTLMGSDKIAVPPLQFYTADGSEFYSLQYLGSALCGHPNIVHGGLLATLLDEGLARCCFPALPNKVGVTASLKIDYKKPCLAGQFVVLRAETTKVDGRKAWVKGRLETLVDEAKGEKAEVLCEAEALFIEPRQAAGLMKIYS